jgi:DNA-binding HxlR family transcriptional regulator
MATTTRRSPAKTGKAPTRARAKAPPAPPPELARTPTNCHAREMIMRVADKWSMYIIHVLAQDSPLRFNELKRRVDGVSQRMLTVTLRGLERDGLVRRRMYPEVPPRVEYELTELGGTLRGIVCNLVTWSSAHLAEVDRARAEYDRQERGWATPAER